MPVEFTYLCGGGFGGASPQSAVVAVARPALSVESVVHIGGFDYGPLVRTVWNRAVETRGCQKLSEIGVAVTAASLTPGARGKTGLEHLRADQQTCNQAFERTTTRGEHNVNCGSFPLRDNRTVR